MLREGEPQQPPCKVLVIVLFCFTAEAVCYVDRTNISIAIVAMSRDYGWDDAARSLVLSSFFIGYMTTQVIGGVLSRRYGGRIVLGVGVVVWSTFTMATPFAASQSFAALIACRICMGIGEGVAMPSIHQLLGVWVPAEWRSIATAFATSGQAVGTIAAMMSTPLAARSWQSLFLGFGALGLVWTATFAVASPKEGTSRVAGRSGDDGRGDQQESVELETVELEDYGMEEEEEDDVIVDEEEEEEVGAKQASRTQWKVAGRMACHPPVWGIFIAHFAHNYGYYVLLSWMPQYFISLGVSLASVGAFAVGPYIAMVLFDTAWASVMDACVHRKIASRLTVRKVSQGVAFATPAALLTYLSLCPPPPPALASLLLSIALGLNSASHSAYWANIIDVAPRNAGLLCGISNTLATIPGIVGNVLTGGILTLGDGNWSGVFLVAVANYVVGLLAYWMLASAEPINFESDEAWGEETRRRRRGRRRCGCGGDDGGSGSDGGYSKGVGKRNPSTRNS